MRKTLRAVATAFCALVPPARTAAQTPAVHDPLMAGSSMDMATGDSFLTSKHMRMTPPWPLQAGDSARAESLVTAGRTALAKYADVRVAEASGFTMFAPKVKQRVYHYTRRLNALKARWSFDPAQPTSLLYAPQADGSVRLIGAMYTAPPDMSLEDLNRRIPLSIAQWHQHTSLCLPPDSSRRGAGDAMAIGTRDPRFGARGSIATEAECTAAGGEFRPRMFGWMVHVNLFEPDAQLWEHRH
jgi:hypothetical protein